MIAALINPIVAITTSACLSDNNPIVLKIKSFIYKPPHNDNHD